MKNLSFDNVNEEDYDKAYKEYKTSRDNFARKLEDQRAPKVERLMYEEMKKLADMRLDMLNMTFNRPAETAAGKDFVKRTDQTISGKWYRFRQWVKRNLGNLGGGFLGLGSFIVTIWQTIVSAGRKGIEHMYTAASAIGDGAEHMGDGVASVVGPLISAASYLVPSKQSLDTISNTANTTGNVVSTGIKIGADVIKGAADVGKFVVDNTITFFVAIITIIGVLYSMTSTRK